MEDIIINRDIYEMWKKKMKSMGKENLSEDQFISWVASQIENIW
jgi:hypothetical protein